MFYIRGGIKIILLNLIIIKYFNKQNISKNISNHSIPQTQTNMSQKHCYASESANTIIKHTLGKKPIIGKEPKAHKWRNQQQSTNPSKLHNHEK